MRRRHIVTAAALATLAAMRISAQTLTGGVNVNINRQAGYQAEESVSIDPTNPSRMFAWSNDLNARNSAAFSINGGASWTSRFTGSDGWPALGGDPTSSFDNFGNLYAASFNSAFTQILMRASTNAGQTFGLNVGTITGSGLDQPTVKAGPSLLPQNQSVWVTYDTNTGLVARGATVTGLGTIGPLGGVLALPGSAAGNFGDIAIGPNGKVAIGYQTPSGTSGPSTINVVVNPNGNTLGPFTLATGTVATNVGGFRSIPAQPSRTVDSELGLAYDNSNGPHRGRLYMVYTDAPTTASSDLNIFTRFSDNDGASWSNALRVNTDAGASSQFFSKIALDPTTGNVAVAWYDCRNSASNNREELFTSVSLNGGVSFLPEVKVSAASSSGVGAGSGNELGDYIGLDFYGNVAYPVWSDNSNSTGDNPNGTSNLDYYGARVVLVGSRWNLNGSGTWSPLANWFGAGVPNAADAVATFGSVITAPVTITVDSPKTVGTIFFDSANAYTLAGSSTITLQSSTHAELHLISGATHVISAPISVLSETQINVDNAASSLNITGTFTATGQSISKNGFGRAQLENLLAGSLTISAGTLAISSKATSNSAAGASRLTGLTITGGALDLTNNTLVLDAVTPSFVRGQLQTAFNGGSWNGGGITSTNAKALAFTAHPTALGYGTGADLGLSGGIFAGQSISATSLIVAYAFAGDANLDGLVNALDFNAVANNFGASGAFWTGGDFDYDGKVNNQDFTLMSMNFNQVLASPALADLVPEPSLVLLTFAPVVLPRRRFAAAGR